MSSPKIALALLAATALSGTSPLAAACPDGAPSGDGVAALSTDVQQALPPSEIQELAEKLDRVGKECPGRVWPDPFLGRTQILIIDEERSQAWLWNAGGDGSTGDLQPVPWSQVESRSELRAPYSFPDWNGIPTTAVNLGRYRGPQGTDYSGAFATTVHEAFHRHEQQDWQIAAAPEPEVPFADRAIEIPTPTEPRYLRSQMLRAFRRSLEEPGHRDDHLADAAHWRSRFEHECSSDHRTSQHNDIAEASARYFDAVASSVGELGCTAPEPDLQAHLVGRLNGDPAAGRSPGFSDFPMAGAESYDLFVALVSLRARGVPGWEGRLMAGERPDLLATEGVAARRPAEDPARLSEITEITRNISGQGIPHVETARANLASRNMVRIAVPASANQGAFSSVGFYRAEGLPGVLTLTTRQTLEWTGGSVRIQAEHEPHPTLMQGSNACGSGNHVVLLVPASALQTSAGLTSHTGAGLELQGRFEARSDAEGNPWLCAAQ